MKLPAVLAKVMLFLLCALQATQGRAAHAMGGEIFYNYLGGGDFEITLIFYRECYNSSIEPSGWQNGGTNLDPTIKLGVYELNNLYALYNVDLVEASIEPLETVLENPCGNLPPDLCMQRLEYTIVVNLPASDTGYDSSSSAVAGTRASPIFPIPGTSGSP